MVTAVISVLGVIAVGFIAGIFIDAMVDIDDHCS
ncbi:MAG: hypothetical protein V7606_381 [Burkholderiales bacterium]|jgi:hypothetical protein